MNSDSLPTRASAPYFCFKCNKYLNAEHVQNFLCRFCNTGFIEEIHPGVNNLTDDDSPNNSNSEPFQQLLGMVLGGTPGFLGGPSNNASGQNTANSNNASGQNTPRTATDFIQSTLMPAFLQAMANSNNASGQNTNDPSSSGGRTRRHSAGNTDQAQQQPQQNEGGGFLEQLLTNLIPSNTSIRIQFGGGGGMNLGDFALGDANFDEIVTQILNQFDPSANTQRISDEHLQHLPRTRVNQQQVDNESQCTTCMDQFNYNEEVAELGCHHIFHADCLVPWLRNHNTCPICRAVVDPEAENWTQNQPAHTIAQENGGFKDGDELD